MLREVVLSGETQTSRSLIQEHLNHEATCHLLSSSTTSQVTVKTVLALSEIREQLTNNTEREEDHHEVDLTSSDSPVVLVLFNIDAVGQTVSLNQSLATPISGHFEGLRPNSFLKLERFYFYSVGEESLIFIKSFQEITSVLNIVCDTASNLNINEKKEWLVLSRSNICRNPKKPGLYFFVLCQDSNNERFIFKINRVSKYFLMGETKAFSVKDEKISLLETESFELNKYYGNLPVFDIDDDDVEILPKKFSELNKIYYNLREVELIPLDEPVNIRSVVIERGGDLGRTESLSSKICFKISAEEDLSVTYNLYLPSSSSSCELIWPGKLHTICSNLRYLIS